MNIETQQAIQAVEVEINNSHYDREEVIRGMLVGALTGENVAVLGRAGTGKSALVRDFASAIGVRVGNNGGYGYFETLMTKFSTPEQLFGPFRLTALQQDRFERNGDNMLQEARVAFLDEVFKSNASCLNATLPLLNERIYHENGQAHDVPLELVVGASNELPSDEGLGALWDRFLIRFEVQPLAEGSRLALLRAVADNTLREVAACVTDEQWVVARQEYKAIVIDDEMLRYINRAIVKLGEQGIVHGDRRWVKCLAVTKAVAYLNGLDEVDEDCVEFLQHCLWDEPTQRKTIAEVLQASASPEVADTKRIYDAVVEFVERAGTVGSVEDAYKVMKEMRIAAKKVRVKLGSVKAGTRAHTKIEHYNQLLKTKYEELNDIIRKLTAVPAFDQEEDLLETENANG